MADLNDVAVVFHARHGRRLKIATKCWDLTHHWFRREKHGPATAWLRGSDARAPPPAEAIVDIAGSSLPPIQRMGEVLAGGADAPA